MKIDKQIPGHLSNRLDDLLRGEVFVDLFKVVRNAVRLSTESYSLKAVEKLYTQRADGAVMDAGSLEDANDLLNALGVRTELDLEREAASR